MRDYVLVWCVKVVSTIIVIHNFTQFAILELARSELLNVPGHPELLKIPVQTSERLSLSLR